jgi:predicted ATPase
MSEKFIITGAPGSGISTLFKALKKQGYTCFQDNISFNCKQKSDNPSNNPGGKSREECMLDAMLKRYQESNNHPSTCFFERAIPDLIAFLKHQKADVPEKYEAWLNNCPFNKNAFMLPPWPGLVVYNTEKWRTFDQDMDLYFQLYDTYSELGFRLWEVPTCEPEGRVAYIASVLLHLKQTEVSNA